jgi:hypothetical protein
MTVDAKGVMYMTGATASTNFPTTSGAYKTSNASDTHAFVSVLDPSQEGSAGLIYSSYFGGTGKRDEADAIALSGGKVYIAGFTNSPDLPVVAPIQTNYVNNYDAFVAAFDPTQGGSASLVLSTYFGGSLLDAAHAVAVDSAGRVYIAGVTYSTYQAAYAGEGDAFLTVMDFTAGTLVYSTYFGGTSPDDIKKILIDPSGRVAMTGYTGSSDFPITQNAYQARFGGNGNAILTILDITKAGQGLVYSSYFGGSGGEVAYDLTRDGAGRYYLGGYTVSSDLPVAGSPLNGATAGAGVDGFLAVIDPAAPPLGSNALVYSTYITGQGFQVVYGLDVDASSVYVAGFTTADIFPSGAAQNSHPGKYDGFLLVLTLP